MRVTGTGLLLFAFIVWTGGQEIKHEAISSDIPFDFKPCTDNSVYRIHHNDYTNIVTILIFCGFKHQIPHKFEGRIRVNESAGRVTLCNITKSDGGLYTLELTNGKGRKEPKREIKYVIYDKVWISELSRNDTGGNISLTVACAGGPDTIIWTMDGGDLPDGYWLSDDNRTLTTPYDVTDELTVNVSNLVSAEAKNITLINDVHGKPSYVGPIMYQNITRVIWSDGGGEPGNQTLILRRNVTNINVMTWSGNNETEVHQYRNHIIILVVLAFIIIIILASVVGLVRRSGTSGIMTLSEVNIDH